VQDSSLWQTRRSRIGGFPYDVVAQCVDEQLRDIAEMAPEVVPLTRSEYRHLVKDRIADMLEIAWLSGLGEDESGKVGIEPSWSCERVFSSQRLRTPQMSGKGESVLGADDWHGSGCEAAMANRMPAIRSRRGGPAS
jgi:hypothetical protein